MAGVDLSSQLEGAFVKGEVPLGLAAQQADLDAQKANDDLIDRDKPDPPLERKELVDVRFVPALPGIAREL